MRLGIGVSEDLTIAIQQRIAEHVEAAGFTSLWTNEARGRDALLLCQAWAAATTDLQVGIGVVPIWTRSPAQLAMASATLAEASGGRFLLGLGVSHPATMAPGHGAEVVKPLTASREILTILDRLEAGERADFVGEVLRCEKFRLTISPLPPATRRYLAAMGPKMLALAGSDARGVLLNWSSPGEVERAAGIVRQAAVDADRDPADVEVAGYVRVAVADDLGAAKAALAAQIGQYAALPAYASHFARQGFGDAVERVKAAHKSGADAAGLAEALGDEVLDAFGWAATGADDPEAFLASYRDAGLDHLVARVVVSGEHAEDSVHAVVRALDTATAAR